VQRDMDTSLTQVRSSSSQNSAQLFIGCALDVSGAL
jgi:hypothetical protein